MMLEAQQTRIEWIDALKGLGISLIVLGHVWSLEQPPEFYVWLFAFHVPVFFFASGLTLRPDKTALFGFLRRRTVQLMLPYLVYALLGYVFYLIGYGLSRNLSVAPAAFDYGLLRPLIGILEGRVGDGRLVNSPVWFLPALLIALGLTHGINRLVRNHTLRLSLIVGLSGSALLLAERVVTPLGLSTGVIAILFVQLGYEYRQRGYPSPNTDAYTIALLMVTLLISLFARANGPVGLAGPTVNNPALFVLFAINGIAVCVMAVRLAPSAVQRLLAAIGHHSLAILVTHMLIIKSLKVMLSLAGGVSFYDIEHSLPLGLVVLAATAVLSIPTVWFIERWLPWSLGRFSR
ncbi:acyltransferase family protein [Spiribacter sp. C176]|uniref:Acyltransferase family protein n=1 Tax=Spiribacter salilacus TaxID=2664894 RepID=A0A6N7QUJ6_9GAMM|nr:acyltransferase family protein [Spiribacter salilacus]MRH79033.1 acyltransferase family protein [Spiribacter salilacus]